MADQHASPCTFQKRLLNKDQAKWWSLLGHWSIQKSKSARHFPKSNGHACIFNQVRFPDMRLPEQFGNALFCWLRVSWCKERIFFCSNERYIPKLQNENKIPMNGAMSSIYLRWYLSTVRWCHICIPRKSGCLSSKLYICNMTIL